MVAELAQGDEHVAWRGSADGSYRTHYRPAHHLPVEAGPRTKRFGEAGAGGESCGTGVGVRPRTGRSWLRARRGGRWDLSPWSVERFRAGHLEFRNEVGARETRR